MGNKRLREKRGPGTAVSIGMVEVVALEDFTGAGRDMIAGGTYSVPEDKAKFWVAHGQVGYVIEEAVKEATPPRDKMVRKTRTK